MSNNSNVSGPASWSACFPNITAYKTLKTSRYTEDPRAIHISISLDLQALTFPTTNMICSTFTTYTIVCYQFSHVQVTNGILIPQLFECSDCNFAFLFHIVIFSKEHKSHSPACNFILLKKSVNELSVEELLKLQKERQKFLIVSRVLGWGTACKKKNVRLCNFPVSLIPLKSVSIIKVFQIIYITCPKVCGPHPNY